MQLENYLYGTCAMEMKTFSLVYECNIAYYITLFV